MLNRPNSSNNLAKKFKEKKIKFNFILSSNLINNNDKQENITSNGTNLIQIKNPMINNYKLFLF